MAITLKNITKIYSKRKIINDISLDVKKGTFNTFLGANGAGKSTLLSLIGRLIKIDDGKIFIDEEDITKIQNNLIAKKLSILKQRNYIDLQLTVEELIAFGRYPYSKGKLNQQDKDIIDEAIEYMELNHIRFKNINELSGGQQQMVFITMILVQNTDYILLDEPLNNLDMKNATQVMQKLKKLSQDKNKTIITILHDINFASVYSDYIYAIKEGRLIYQGSPKTIMQEQVLYEIYNFHIPVHNIDGNNLALYFLS